MEILAHRGLWRAPDERNRPAALREALAKGYGVETDVRDADGKLVIAHDPATASAPLFEALLEQYSMLDCAATLAINVKADGLRPMLKRLLEQHGISAYFCFDMSLPETLAYRRDGLKYFTRVSEYEPSPSLYEAAAGVWMDMFEGDWIQPADILAHLDAGKQVALVSPELHRRPHENFWRRLRDAGLTRRAGLLLCTDFPEAAEQFFA